MEQQNKIKPDNKTIKKWRHHLQDEVDASFLYSVFAQLESDPDRKDILLELADVESRHVARWEQMLTSYDVNIQKQNPTLKARFWAWYARKFGSTFPLARMLEEEASEVKDYLTLHKKQHTGRC